MWKCSGTYNDKQRKRKTLCTAKFIAARV